MTSYFYQQWKNLSWPRIVISVIPLTGLAALMAAIASSSESSPTWSDIGNRAAAFLYDWQTLIAGILAVAAAAVTIKQSQNKEKGDAERHEQLMDLTVRLDRLRVGRFMAKYQSMLANLQAELMTFVSAFPSDLPSPILTRNIIMHVNYIKKLDTITSASKNIQSQKEWLAAEELFDGIMTMRAGKFAAINEIVASQVMSAQGELSRLEGKNQHVGIMIDDELETSTFHDQALSHLDAALSGQLQYQVVDLLNATTELNASIQDLRSEYGRRRDKT